MRRTRFAALTAAALAAARLAAQVPTTLPPTTLPPVSGTPADPPPALFPTPYSSATPVSSAPTQTLPEPCRDFYTPKVWASGEFILFQYKDGGNPQPLATLAPADGNGAIGQAGTRIAFGSRDLDFGTFDGLKGEVGWWFSSDARWGVGLGGFILERRSQTFLLDGAALPNSVVARPYVDATTGTEESELVSLPGVFTGRAFGSATSRLWAGDANLYYNTYARGTSRLDLYTGFKYLDLKESLQLGEVTYLDDTQSIGTSVLDSFSTRNQFYGGSLGARGTYSYGRASFHVGGAVSLGSNNQTVNIAGSTNAFNGPDINSIAAGLLATTSNQGRYGQNKFAVLPETTVKVGYQFSDRLNAYVGYNALWLSNTVRPGDQVDRTINPNNAPILSGNTTLTATAPFRPSADLTTTNFAAHGVSLGLSLQY